MAESKNQNFNHLKIHSQYSICEGAIKIDDLKEFSKENEAFVVKGGLMDSEPLTVDQLNVLAEIEPRDVLIAKIAGGFNAPLVKVAAGAKAVINKAGYALSALVDKKASGEEVSETADSVKEEVASEEVKKEEE